MHTYTDPCYTLRTPHYQQPEGATKETEVGVWSWKQIKPKGAQAQATKKHKRRDSYQYFTFTKDTYWQLLIGEKPQRQSEQLNLTTKPNGRESNANSFWGCKTLTQLRHDDSTPQKLHVWECEAEQRRHKWLLFLPICKFGNCKAKRSG